MIVNGTDLSMMRGDSDGLIVSCVDGEIERPFADGDTVTLTIKTVVSDEIPALKKSLTEFDDLGRAVFVFAPEDTRNMWPTDYIYDIQLETAGETITIIEPDTFTLRGDVTP